MQFFSSRHVFTKLTLFTSALHTKVLMYTVKKSLAFDHLIAKRSLLHRHYNIITLILDIYIYICICYIYIYMYIQIYIYISLSIYISIYAYI